MLVADSLDVVLAEAVVEHCGALEGLDGNDAGAVVGLEAFTCREGSRRSGCGDEGGQFQIGPLVAVVFVDALQGTAGHLVVADVVGELGELVEDEVVGVEAELVAGVVDLLDVALRTGGADHVIGVGDPAVKPFETLAAHILG